MPDFRGNSPGYAVGGLSRGAGFDDEDIDEECSVFAVFAGMASVDVSGGYHIQVRRELDSRIQNHVQRLHHKWGSINCHNLSYFLYFEVRLLTLRTMQNLSAREGKAQVDQESQIKMTQVNEMMQDKDLKNSKSKDKGTRSRSQSMNEQSHYKQENTKTRPKKAKLKRHIFNIGEDKVKIKINSIKNVKVGEIKEDLNIGEDC
nr:hypothetical protein [Tanacetum cinerariifolium]